MKILLKLETICLALDKILCSSFSWRNTATCKTNKSEKNIHDKVSINVRYIEFILLELKINIKLNKHYPKQCSIYISEIRCSAEDTLISSTSNKKGAKALGRHSNVVEMELYREMHIRFQFQM